MNGSDLRSRIYDSFVRVGSAPSLQEINEWFELPAEAGIALRRLHETHAIVLARDGLSISMALPFSNSPTQHLLTREAQSWFANCAWDAFAIPIALGSDAHIESQWLDDKSAVHIDVVNGEID